LGVKVFKDFPLNEISEYIDWAPFFSVWELKGRFPDILENEQAKQVYDDAQKMLEEIITNKSLTNHIYIFRKARRKKKTLPGEMSLWKKGLPTRL